MQEPADENKSNPSEYDFTCESGKVSNNETFRVSAFSGSQSIGKGSLAIMFSQVLFLGFNFLLRYFLAQNVTPADVDIYHLVVSVLIMSFQRIIHYGLPVAVSKYLSEDPARFAALDGEWSKGCFSRQHTGTARRFDGLSPI